MYHCFSRFLDLFPAIGEQQNNKVYFQQFSPNGDIYVVCEKISELDGGETVLQDIQIAWCQDLRVQHIQFVQIYWCKIMV